MSNEPNWHGEDLTRASRRESFTKPLIIPRESCKSGFSSRGYRTGKRLLNNGANLWTEEQQIIFFIQTYS